MVPVDKTMRISVWLEYQVWRSIPILTILCVNMVFFPSELIVLMLSNCSRKSRHAVRILILEIK